MSKFDSNIVDCNNSSFIGNRTYNSRYSLKIKSLASQSADTAIVILKNPATTCKAGVFYNVPMPDTCDVDKTTKTVIDKLASTYGTIITLNLFPYFDNTPKSLNAIYGGILTGNQNLSYNENLKEINLILRSYPNAAIYTAWGKQSGIHKGLYDRAINDVLQLLKKYNINSVIEFNGTTFITTLLANINVGFYPLHASKW